jgi:hypothetical protein
MIFLTIGNLVSPSKWRSRPARPLQTKDLSGLGLVRSSHAAARTSRDHVFFSLEVGYQDFGG